MNTLLSWLVTILLCASGMWFLWWAVNKVQKEPARIILFVLWVIGCFLIVFGLILRKIPLIPVNL